MSSYSELSLGKYYDILAVPRHATMDEIKKAYKKAALKLHPDKPGGSEEAFKAAAHAANVLTDVDQRRAYDHRLAMSGSRDGLRSTDPPGPAFVDLSEGPDPKASGPRLRRVSPPRPAPKKNAAF